MRPVLVLVLLLAPVGCEQPQSEATVEATPAAPSPDTTEQAATPPVRARPRPPVRGSAPAPVPLETAPPADSLRAEDYEWPSC